MRTDAECASSVSQSRNGPCYSQTSQVEETPSSDAASTCARCSNVVRTREASNSSEAANYPAVLIFTNLVDIGRRKEQEDWLQRAPELISQVCGADSARVHNFPGQRVDADGWRCDTVVLTFRSQPLAERWLHSDVRREWMQLAEGPLQRRLTQAQVQLDYVALGDWLPASSNHSSDARLPSPPTWRVTCVVYLALFPTVALMQVAALPALQRLLPLLETQPDSARLAESLAITTVFMSYASLPLSRAALADFLKPSSARKTAVQLLLVVALFVVLLALVALAMD